MTQVFMMRAAKFTANRTFSDNESSEKYQKSWETYAMEFSLPDYATLQTFHTLADTF